MQFQGRPTEEASESTMYPLASPQTVEHPAPSPAPIGKSLSSPFSRRNDHMILSANTSLSSALRSPNPLWLTGLFSLAILVLSPVILLVTPWQQTAKGKGHVVSYDPDKRPQTIEAPIGGRIENWLVQEGERVVAGQELVALSDMDPKIIERLYAQKNALQQKVTAGERALTVSERNAARQKKLAAGGVSSERQYELAQLEVARLQADLASAQLELTELQVRISRQESQSVKAPVDGILMRIDQPQGGVIVKEGEPLALLVPESDDRIAALWISGIDLPLVSPGRKVRLQFEGWPAVQFSGWPSVAVGTFGGIVQHVDASGDGDGRYRVLVFPDPNDQPWPDGIYLRQGVRVLSWVLLDEVSLGWELWRQMNGFPKTVSRP